MPNTRSQTDIPVIYSTRALEIHPLTPGEKERITRIIHEELLAKAETPYCKVLVEPRADKEGRLSTLAIYLFRANSGSVETAQVAVDKDLRVSGVKSGLDGVAPLPPSRAGQEAGISMKELGYEPAETFVCVNAYPDVCGAYLAQETIGDIAKGAGYNVLYLGHHTRSEAVPSTLANCLQCIWDGPAVFYLLSHGQGGSATLNNKDFLGAPEIIKDDMLCPKLMFFSVCESFDPGEYGLLSAVEQLHVEAAIGCLEHPYFAPSFCQVNTFWKNVLKGNMPVPEAFSILFDATENKIGKYRLHVNEMPT